MIHTINGPIEKGQMGITMSHEHFKWENDDALAHALYYSHRYEMADISEGQVVIEPIVRDLLAAGVQTVVEASPPAGGQNLMLLRRLWQSTGMQIIPSTGQNALKEMTDLAGEPLSDILANRWIADFEQGLDTLEGVLIRPGYIKLLMDRGPLNPADRTLLKAAVAASQKTGMGIQCHILEAAQVLPILDYVEGEGLDMCRFLWSHADKESCLDTIDAAAQKGVWIGIDIVRKEYHQDRLALLMALDQRNLTKRVLLSSDYDFYEMGKEQGQSHPCGSLLTEFIPMALASGMDAKKVWSMVRENPAAFYDIP